jgi:hypothetical protein
MITNGSRVRPASTPSPACHPATRPRSRLCRDPGRRWPRHPAECGAGLLTGCAVARPCLAPSLIAGQGCEGAAGLGHRGPGLREGLRKVTAALLTGGCHLRRPRLARRSGSYVGVELETSLHVPASDRCRAAVPRRVSVGRGRGRDWPPAAESAQDEQAADEHGAAGAGEQQRIAGQGLVGHRVDRPRPARLLVGSEDGGLVLLRLVGKAGQGQPRDAERYQSDGEHEPGALQRSRRRRQASAARQSKKAANRPPRRLRDPRREFRRGLRQVALQPWAGLPTSIAGPPGAADRGLDRLRASPCRPPPSTVLTACEACGSRRPRGSAAPPTHTACIRCRPIRGWF